MVPSIFRLGDFEPQWCVECPYTCRFSGECFCYWTLFDAYVIQALCCTTPFYCLCHQIKHYCWEVGFYRANTNNLGRPIYDFYRYNRMNGP